MAINTTFAGLTLKSPIIVGSCMLTNSVDNIRKYEQAGAGAVVLKSLFEENIAWEMQKLDDGFDGNDHPEAYDYTFNTLGYKIVSDYIDVIRASKAACHIPVIASIACHSDGKWTEYAQKIQDAGADALELNVMSLCTSKNYKYGDFEQLHINIVKHVCRTIQIPVFVKLGANLSNPVALADALCAYGAKGVVLFNRFYPTDIDVDKLDYVMSNPFTTAADLSQPLRWAGIISAAVPQLSLAVSGGVHDWQGVAKSLLCGAHAVEVASAIIKGGAAWIADALAGLQAWQQGKGFDKLNDYRGKMSAADSENADKLTRVQFLKYFGSIH